MSSSQYGKSVTKPQKGVTANSIKVGSNLSEVSISLFLLQTLFKLLKVFLKEISEGLLVQFQFHVAKLSFSQALFHRGHGLLMTTSNFRIISHIRVF